MRGQILEPPFEIFVFTLACLFFLLFLSFLYISFFLFFFVYSLLPTHVLGIPTLQPFFKYDRSPYNQTFFARTSNNGQPIGDTSNMFGHEQDFVFDYDKTCNDQGNGKKTGRGYRGYGEKIQYSKLMEFMFCLLTFQTQ